MPQQRLTNQKYALQPSVPSSIYAAYAAGDGATFGFAGIVDGGPTGSRASSVLSSMPTFIDPPHANTIFHCRSPQEWNLDPGLFALRPSGDLHTSPEGTLFLRFQL